MPLRKGDTDERMKRYFMSMRKSIKCSAAVCLIALVSAVGLSTTVMAENYYNDGQDYTYREDSGVEYIPPENDSYDGYNFDDYHEGADDYYDGDTYDNNYGFDDGTSYEQSEEISEETSQEESSQDGYTDESEILDQISVDTNELTSKDWENIQKTLNSKPSSNKQAGTQSNNGESSILLSDNGKDEFGTLKDKSESNDVGQYLAYGILLLLAGITIMTTVIVINVKANRKTPFRRKKQSAADPLSMSLRDVQENKRNSSQNKGRRSSKGGRHSSRRRQSYPGAMQNDLVDILDDPKNLDYTGEI